MGIWYHRLLHTDPACFRYPTASPGLPPEALTGSTLSSLWGGHNGLGLGWFVILTYMVNLTHRYGHRIMQSSANYTDTIHFHSVNPSRSKTRLRRRHYPAYRARARPSAAPGQHWSCASPPGRSSGLWCPYSASGALVHRRRVHPVKVLSLASRSVPLHMDVLTVAPIRASFMSVVKGTRPERLFLWVAPVPRYDPRFLWILHMVRACELQDLR